MEYTFDNPLNPEAFASARPTEEQLALINQYTPANLPPVTADEVIVIHFVAADNLVNRGKGKWHISAMSELTDLLPGLPFTLDHDWDEVGKTQGIVFEAWAGKYAEAPSWALDRAGNRELNQKIVAAEGYLTVECNVYFPLRSEFVEGLRLGLFNGVSMGGFTYTDILCPLCDDSFNSKHCPHYAPSPWDDFGDEETAPYYIRYEVTDLLELSQVLAPNLPAAGLVRRYQAPAFLGNTLKNQGNLPGT